MRRLAFVLSLLCLTLSVIAQAPAAPQKKSITDPDEYKVYMAARDEQTPARKIQLLDEFLTKYPNTVVKEDALELKMVAQQQAGQSFDAVARQILQINPINFRTLLMMSYVFALAPPSDQDPQYQQKLSDAERTHRNLLRGFQNHRVAQNKRVGDRPIGDHIRKVERRYGGNNTHRIAIDAAFHTFADLEDFAGDQLRHGAGKLRDFNCFFDLRHCFAHDLAVLFVDKRGEFLRMFFHECLVAEEHLYAFLDRHG